jgi:hypothetical protein
LAADRALPCRSECVTSDAAEAAEKRAEGLVEKARTLRMSIRGDRAAAGALARADAAQTRTLTLITAAA